MRNWLLFRLIVLVALALALSACTSRDDGESPTGGAPDPTEPANGAETDQGRNEPPVVDSSTTNATTVPPTGEELVIWVDELRALALEDLQTGFEASTGVELVIVVKEIEDIRSELVGDGGPPPDVFVGPHTWAVDLEAQGLIGPIDLGPAVGDVIPIALNAFSLDGARYGLPFSADAVALIWNRGLIPVAPTELSAFGPACEEAEVASCVGLPTGDRGATLFHAYGFLAAQGGYIYREIAGGGHDPADRGILDLATGLGELQGFVASGVVTPVSYDTIRNDFFDGIVPYMIAGPWELGPARDAGVDVAAAPLPTLDGAPMRPLVNVLGFYRHAATEQPGEVELLLREFVATPDAMAALHAVDPRAPVYVPLIESLESDASVAAFVGSVESGVIAPADSIMARVWEPLGEAVGAVLDGALLPAAALMDADEEIAGDTG